MNKKTIKSISVGTVLAIAMFAIVGVGTSYAFEGNGQRGDRSERQERGGERRGGGAFFQSLTDDERASIKAERENLTDDEREAFREERQASREERRAAFESFTGLSKDEVKEIKKSGGSVEDALEDNGVSESELRNYFEDQAEERVEDLVERHNLSDATESTLLEQVSDFVDKMIERLFKVKTQD